MALNTLKCNYLTPLHFKGLIWDGARDKVRVKVTLYLLHFESKLSHKCLYLITGLDLLFTEEQNYCYLQLHILLILKNCSLELLFRSASASDPGAPNKLGE